MARSKKTSNGDSINAEIGSDSIEQPVDSEKPAPKKRAAPKRKLPKKDAEVLDSGEPRDAQDIPSHTSMQDIKRRELKNAERRNADFPEEDIATLNEERTEQAERDRFNKEQDDEAEERKKKSKNGKDDSDDDEPKEKHFGFSKKTEDAGFLAPDEYSFGLKPKKVKGKSGSRTTRSIIYFLGIFVIIAAVAVFLTTYYSAKQLDNENQVGSNTNSTQPTGSSAGSNTFAIVGGHPDVNTFVANSLKTALGNSADTSTQNTVPAVTADTLFFKSASQQKASDLVSLFNTYGLKVLIQSNDSISDDFVLSLVSTLNSVDLSGLTATAANASGATGAAKKYCDTLNAYKVASCSAINATANQNGLSVFYKDDKVFVNLKRTAQFGSATFTKAPTGQVEDIRVVVGK